LRILTFTSLFPNSVDPTLGIFIYQRSAHLAQRPGIDVAVVSPVPWFPRWLKTRRWRSKSEIPSEEKFGSLFVQHPRYPLLPKISMPLHALLMFLGTLGCVRRLNRAARIHCIDAHFIYPDGLVAVLLGKILSVPVTVSARGSDINYFPSFRLIRPMIRWTLSQADRIVAVSAALKESMVPLGANPKKIIVVPNGVDAEVFRPMDRDAARASLHLPPQAPLLVCVGALIRPKGHLNLIRAFAAIATRRPDATLYILGEGPLRAELQSLVRELHLQDRVHLPGKRPNAELPQWFNAAAISVLMSEREGWPNVITESLACGTPVVATRVGGVPEILHSPELGIVVDQNVESITRGVEKALAKAWDREAISAQIRARTWDTVASEMEAIFFEQIRSGDAVRK
jgi:glycosyltransferase involved in cell wall biosynthesis